MKKQLTTTTLCILLTLSGCTTLPERDLAAFSELDQECYNRNTEPYTFVADTHVHFRPFGGAAIPFTEMIDYFRETGVLFVNVYGIGQILPTDSPCTYYLDCPGTPALPSIKNDFVKNIDGYSSLGIVLSTCLGGIAILYTLSISNGLFPMALVLLTIAVCSAHNAAILTVQKPIIIYRLLVLSTLVNLLIIGSCMLYTL